MNAETGYIVAAWPRPYGSTRYDELSVRTMALKHVNVFQQSERKTHNHEGDEHALDIVSRSIPVRLPVILGIHCIVNKAKRQPNI